MVTIPGGAVTLGVEGHRQRWQQAPRTATLETYCIDVYEYPNQKGVLPKASVTWEEAREACEAEGKRLCTSDEWGRACRGTEGRSFAYGEVRDAERCNTPLEGSGPQGARLVLPSGSFEKCVSPEGVVDLNGSLSEWVSDPWAEFVEPFHSDPTSRAQPERWRALRGGTMWSDTFYGQDCTSRHGHDKNYFRGDDDGFRCCVDLR